MPILTMRQNSDVKKKNSCVCVRLYPPIVMIAVPSGLVRRRSTILSLEQYHHCAFFGSFPVSRLAVHYPPPGKTNPIRQDCRHRAIHVVHGERWERYTWPHTHGDWGGMHEHVHETREVAASRERPMRTSKNIGVFCGYTLVAGLSRGFTCICGQGVAHAAVGFACSALREGHSPRGGPKA